jgi:hypothetical protein
MPGIGPLHHPAFLPWSEPFGPFRPCLDLDSPHGAMFRHPCAKGMMVILVVGNARFETGDIFRVEPLQSWRCRDPIVHPRTRDQHHKPSPQGVDQERPCAPWHLLATIIAALSPAHGCRLHRWALDTRRTGSGLPTGLPAGLFAPRRQHGAHGPSSRHRAQSSSTVLVGSQSCGRISHGHPLRFRDKSVFTTARMSTCRGRPPCWVWAAGMSGARIVHWACVRSEGYSFRTSVSLAMVAHAFSREGCANCPRDHVLWQVQFPDSL